jgi:phage terminase small subunit
MGLSRLKHPDPALDGLNAKQISFVEHFLSEEIFGNAQQAAKRAGYKMGGVTDNSRNGWQILNHPEVSRAIATKLQRRLASGDGDAIKTAVARIAMADMSNFLSVEEVEGADGEITSRFVIDAAKARDALAIGQIKEYRETYGNVSLKLHDPLPALQILAKIVGLVKDQVEHSGKVQFHPITLDGDKELTAESPFN